MDRLVNVVIKNDASSAISPVVSITSPVAGTTVSGQTTLQFSATIGGGYTISTREISVDGGSFVSTTTTTSHTWSTGALADGSHTVQIRATGSNGTSTTSELVIYITANAPSITLAAPRADTVVSGDLAVLFTATPVAPATVASTQISVDGGAWTATTTTATHALSTQALTDGSHTVQVKVTDSNGKTGLSQILKFNVQNLPTVTLTAPRADTVVSGDLAVLFTATPVAPATVATTQISVDGGAWTATTTTATHALSTQTLTDGSHTVQVRATDSNGKTGLSQVVKFNVQNLPTVIMTAPRADTVVSGTLVVQFTVTPVSPATIASTQISVDGGTWRATTTATTDTLNTQPMTDGSHTVQVKATDSNGKSGLSQIIKFNILNSPSIMLLAPKGDSLYAGDLALRYVTDPVEPATVASVLASVDGAAWITLNSGSDTLLDTLDTRPWSDGVHTLVLKVTDTQGKTGLSGTVKFQILNSPVVVIDSPIAGTVLYGRVTVRFTVTPVAPAIVESTWLSIDGGPWLATATLTTDTLESIELLDNAHTLQIRALDDQGKTGLSRTVSISTRNAPSVAFTSPGGGDTLRGVVPVLFSALSPGDSVALTQISINGKAFRNTSTPASDTLDTRTMGDGEHVLKLRVTDAHGKVGESELLVIKVDNTAPVISMVRVSYPLGAGYARSGAEVVVTAFARDEFCGLVDSTVTLLSTSASADSAQWILNDAGTNGDSIAGDHIYSCRVVANTDTTGAVGYLLAATDHLGNSDTLSGVLILDNIAPHLAISCTPKAEDGLDSLTGRVYFERVVLSGRFGDAGGSGIESVLLRVQNDSNADVKNSPVNLSAKDTLFSRIVELVPGFNRVTVTILDKAGNRIADTALLTYIVPKVTVEITSRGGLVQAPDGAGVSIPAGALLNPLTVSIRRVDASEEPKPLDNTLRLLGTARDFGPDGTVFRKPVALTLSYSQADLDPNQDQVPDFDESKLGIYFYDGEGWRNAGVPEIDTAANTLTVNVNHFTIYDIGQVADTAPPAKIKSFWTHNPLVLGRSSTFQYETPADATVTLKIFDLTGDLVRTVIDKKSVRAGLHTEMWNGNNASERYAGSGLYVYIFTCETAAEKKTVKKPIALINR
ncbi:MAG: Ig-like domain-containing protein [Fibrobacterota bacterium]